MNAPAGRKALLGAAFWAAAALGVTAAVESLEPATRGLLEHVKVEMWRAVLDPAPTYTILFRGGARVERDNGVFAVVNGRLARVGEVVRVRADDAVPADLHATIALDDRTGFYRPTAGAVAVCRSQGRSFLFALKTLVPEPRWQQIQREWASFRSQHQADLTRELEPLAGRLLAVTLSAVAAELPDALERHRRDLDLVATRMRQGLAQEQVRSLLTEELWPIVVLRMAAPAEVVGRELWDRLPLMSFALRAAADRLLEDEPVRVEERWRRFVQEEALPSLRAHQPELEQAFGQIVKDVLSSDAIQARAAAVWAGIRDDQAVQALARTLTRELLVQNPRLDAALRALADDPETKARVQRLGVRFQDFLDPLGELLLLDKSGKGINPELAQLIRLLLLRRDAQVIYLEGGSGPPLPPGSELPGRDDS